MSELSGLVDVVMIVKDEERDLPTALGSMTQLRPILGRVCIYDTGSSDRTVAIAQSWGAHVKRGYWDDDFARARNESISMSSAPWCLCIDADELVVVDVESFGRQLADVPNEIDVLICKLIMAHDHVVTGVADALRLFRPGRAHYRNRIHEKVVSRIEGAGLKGAAVCDDALMVSHFGYEPGESMELRGERNLRIAQLQLDAVRPGDLDGLAEALLNRGRSYALAGRPVEALGDYRSAWATESSSGYRKWAGEELAERLTECGEYTEAEAVLDDLVALGSDAQLCRWLQARLRYAQGDPARALALVRSVDKPQHAMGRLDSWGPVLTLRALASAACGERDEALASAIAAVAGHGATGDLGRLIVALWRPRPAAALAELMVSAGTRHAAGAEAELRAAGPDGDVAADAYLALCAERRPESS